jgi:hypothetical protein
LFEQFGHVILPATDASRTLAWHIMRLSRRAPGLEISGKVRQMDLSSDADFAALREQWETLVREAAASLGVNVEQLHVVDPKLLVAPPNPKSGLDQPVHWDCARDAAAASKFSCLLICSTGSFSTALPRFEANAALSSSHDPAAMRSVAHLLFPQEYESVPVSAGDMIFFRQSTPHYGVKNSCPQGDRVVLFSILSPSTAPGQDEHQVMPWLFIGSAFGWDSKEFAQALVDYKAHGPVERIAKDEGRKARNSSIRCLQRWNLFDSYTS